MQQYAAELTAQGVPPEKQTQLLLDIYSLVSNSFDHYFNDLDEINNSQKIDDESEPTT